MSVFIRQNSIPMEYTSDSWAILSPIEQSIKSKIEKYGTPLKNWDVNIYRGILTGCNEAFIIDGEKRAELIAEDPKSDEIIRPILRGRDIKRYGYEFPDLYIIATFPSKHYNIDDYPAVKNWLKSFGKKLEQTGEEYIDSNGIKQKCRKLTNNEWFETQDSIAYWNEFSKQKIIYQELTQEGSFYFDKEGTFYVSNTAYLITGERLEYLTHILNSKTIEFVFRKFYSTSMGGTGIRWLNQYITNLPIHIPTLDENKALCNSKNKEKIIADFYHLTEEEYTFILRNTHYLE